MRVLLAQLCPVAGDAAANAERAADVVAAHPAADLAVFPELFLQGYDLATAPLLALEPGAPEIERVCRAAAEAGTAILVGYAERGPAGVLYNSLAAIDETGRLVATYRKVQVFAGEREVFDAGDQFFVVPLAGVQIGLMLCFDAEFPEPARALATAGADVLVTAAANMDPYHADHELATRARALDNRRPHIYVNRVGSEAGLRFVGGSRVIAADGSVQTQCSEQDEELSIAVVDLQAESDEAVQYLAQVPPRLPVRLIDSVPGGST